VGVKVSRQTAWDGRGYEGGGGTLVGSPKCQPGGNMWKYGNGPVRATVMGHCLIDEFHLLVTPVAVGKGQRLFEAIDSAPQLNRVGMTTFSNGVVILIYAPK